MGIDVTSDMSTAHADDYARRARGDEQDRLSELFYEALGEGRFAAQAERDSLRAEVERLKAACVNVLGSSTHRGQCIFCGARIDEAHAEYCPTIPLRSVIRAAREGK